MRSTPPSSIFATRRLVAIEASGVESGSNYITQGLHAGGNLHTLPTREGVPDRIPTEAGC